MTHTIETLTEKYNAENTTPNPNRIERLAEALALGATDAALDALCSAARTSKTDHIILPAHRYELLSRGRGWARKGRGDSAVWGERCAGGYRVGPGQWTVGGNDGFSRKGDDDWHVEHVTVGDQIWTIAS